MYVYVAEFRDRQGLVKVGVSTNVKVRMKSLEACHGECTSLHTFFVGPTGKRKEKQTHRKFSTHNVKVSGDGGTEFFSRCAKPDILNFLQAQVSKETKEIECLKSMIDKRKNTLNRLIDKIFNGWYSLCGAGYANTILGFPLDECIEKLTKNVLQERYTTYKRVMLVYNCAMNDTVLCEMQTRLRQLEYQEAAKQDAKLICKHFVVKTATKEIVESLIDKEDGCLRIPAGRCYYLREEEMWYEHPILKELHKIVQT